MHSIDTRERMITPRHETQGFESYLHDVSKEKCAPKSTEEEVALFQRLRMGDKVAREEIIKSNLRFVVSIAKHYASSNPKILPDLIQEGNIGLIKAVDKFDETKGFKFISFGVWRIRQSILQYLAKEERSMIRLPYSQINLMKQINAFQEKFMQEHQYPPSRQDIVDGLGIKEDDLKKYNDILGTLKIKKLDAGVDDDGELKLVDIITNENSTSPSLDIERESTKKTLLDAINSKVLTQRQKEIIKLYFGLDGKKPLTLEEIGERLDITRERVRTIKDKVLKILARKPEVKKLYNELE